MRMNCGMILIITLVTDCIPGTPSLRGILLAKYRERIMKKKKLKSYLLSLLSIFCFVFGTSNVTYRHVAYTQMLTIYPNDTLNHAFFLLKVFREIGLWFLTILPIIYLVKVISNSNKSTRLYLIAAVQAVVHLIGLFVVDLFCQNVQQLPFFVSFAVYCIAILVLMGLLYIYEKNNKVN